MTKIKKSFVSGNNSFPKNSNSKKLENFFVERFKKKTDLYDYAYHLSMAFWIQKLRN